MNSRKARRKLSFRVEADTVESIKCHLIRDPQLIAMFEAVREQERLAGGLTQVETVPVEFVGPAIYDPQVLEAYRRPPAARRTGEGTPSTDTGPAPPSDA
jgi:hypothetical protein